MTHRPQPQTRDLEVVLESPVPLPDGPPRFATITDLLDAPEAPEVAARPLLVGEIDGQDRSFDLRDLRAVADRTRGWLQGRGVEPGQTVALLRLPEASELPLAALLVSLLASGVRVLLPTGFEVPDLERQLRIAEVRLVLTAPCRGPSERQRRASRALSAVCRELDLPEATPAAALLDGDGARVEARPARTANPSALVFTTSGTTGRARLVEYAEASLLRCAASWEAAGLFAPELLGGASLVPLLSHTMGVRALLHALWNRSPTLFIRPEWLESQPQRVVGMLVRHRPAHITCGPALLHVWGEYMRAFPVLRERVEPGLRCVVSSGASFDPNVGRLFGSARLADAFGTTETQQVLTGLLSEAGGLGLPLPGCRAGLRWVDGRPGLARLFVCAPFAATGYLGEGEPFGEWIDTGDLVRWNGEALFHAGRADEDFLSSGLGLKVARATLEGDYAGLQPEVAALLPLCLPGQDGFVALAWIRGEATDPDLQERLREATAARTEQLTEQERDTVLLHLPLQALGLVEGTPPLRGPGKIDADRALAEQAGLLAALGDPLADHPRAVRVPPPQVGVGPRQRFLLPRLSQLLEAARLDLDYQTGEGDTLVSDGRPILDLTGGYGANLLGHGRPELIDVATAALRGVPLLDQLSGRSPSARLAEALACRVGAQTGRRYVVALASTGSEAMEMALKHAALWRAEAVERFERRQRQEFGRSHPERVAACVEANRTLLAGHRPVLVALRGAYHGRTVGATHLLDRPEQRAPFEALLGPETVFLDPLGGPEARRGLAAVQSRERLLLRRLARGDDGEVVEREQPFSNILATVAEPIQGEGGIVEVPADWLAALKLPGVPFIIDEIQAGLGRAGSFLASAAPGGPPVAADCYLLGKALGGGLAKLSALLVDRASYVDRFDELRSSTFAEDAFSSRVGLEVLRLIEADDVPGRARRVGDQLKTALLELQRRHPRVLTDVRGRGCMLGVELAVPEGCPSSILAALGTLGLAWTAATYLLHVHGLRVLPPLSRPDVLRIEPSAYLRAEQIARLVAGLDRLCEALDGANVFELTAHLVGVEPDDPRRQAAAAFADAPLEVDFRVVREPPAEGARRVAFVHHILSPAKEMLGDSPSLLLLSTEERLALSERFQTLFELRPMVSFSRNLFSGRVWLLGITIPAMPAVLHHLHRSGETELVLQRLEEAATIAHQQGCGTITFGGFTSVLSRDATRVPPMEGLRFSSGNSFTVAVTLVQLRRACQEQGVPWQSGCLAVVGALGNIGRALADRLARRDGGELLLVGRRGSSERLEALRRELQAGRSGDGPTISCSTEPAELRRADAIVLAVAGPEPVLWPEHVAEDRPVVVADVSQPRASAPGLAAARPDARVFGTGLVDLPEDPDFLLSPHNPRGSLFACASEGVLASLFDEPSELVGPVHGDTVERLRRHGEELGLFDRLLFVP